MTKRNLNKLLFTAFLLGFPFSASVLAQDLTIHVNKKGKVGFVNSAGKEVIKCEYESAFPFENGYAIVSKSDKFGIIDKKGKEVLPVKYSSITPWTEKIYVIKDGKSQGLANHSGQIIVKPDYSFISRPNIYGKALIVKGGKQKSVEKRPCIVGGRFGVINSRGIMVIEPDFNQLYEFTMPGETNPAFGDGFYAEVTGHPVTDTLKTDCSYLAYNNREGLYDCGLLDSHGKIVIKAGTYDVIMRPSNNMVRYYSYKKKTTHCGYYNLRTKKDFEVSSFPSKIDELDFWTHGDFNNTIAPVYDDTWSFVNKNGRTVREDFKKIAFNKTAGLWAAKKSNGKWLVFDNEDNDVDALSGFEEILFPQAVGDADIYMVKKDDKYGGISRGGEEVIPFTYQDAEANSFDVIPVKKNGKWGALNPEGQMIVPLEYSGVVTPSERGAHDLWVKKKDNLYYHYNTAAKSLSSTGYEGVINFIGGIAQVRPVGMKLEDSELNRAQIFPPNASLAAIDTVEVAAYKKGFGYILDSKDNLLMDLPVSTLYRNVVLTKLKALNHDVPTETEKKNILLDVTRENRSYDLGETVNEDEWNY